MLRFDRYLPLFSIIYSINHKLTFIEKDEAVLGIKIQACGYYISSISDFYPSFLCQNFEQPANEFTSFLNKQKAKAIAKVTEKTRATSEDEYTRYCAEDVEWTDDPIAWWLQPVQQVKYPNLSKMAINVLSIPAMSADVERLFSSAGLTLLDRRNRIGTKLLEALECLKSWLKIKEFDLDGDNLGIASQTERQGCGDNNSSDINIEGSNTRDSLID